MLPVDLSKGVERRTNGPASLFISWLQPAISYRRSGRIVIPASPRAQALQMDQRGPTNSYTVGRMAAHASGREQPLEPIGYANLAINTRLRSFIHEESVVLPEGARRIVLFAR